MINLHLMKITKFIDLENLELYGTRLSCTTKASSGTSWTSFIVVIAAVLAVLTTSVAVAVAVVCYLHITCLPLANAAVELACVRAVACYCNRITYTSNCMHAVKLEQMCYMRGALPHSSVKITWKFLSFQQESQLILRCLSRNC